MVWRIEFDAGALRDLRGLDKAVSRRITRFLRERVAPLDDGRSIGAALQGGGAIPMWRYRVGDWRIVVRIEDEVLRVLVVKVGHRREVYRRF